MPTRHRVEIFDHLVRRFALVRFEMPHLDMLVPIIVATDGLDRFASAHEVLLLIPIYKHVIVRLDGHGFPPLNILRTAQPSGRAHRLSLSYITIIHH